MIPLVLATLGLASLSDRIHMAKKKEPGPPRIGRVLLDGSEFFISEIRTGNWTQIEGFFTRTPVREMDEKHTYTLFSDAEEAGRQVRLHYEEEMDNNQEEFATFTIGLDSLISMARGNSAYIGEIGSFKNLEEWLDWNKENPENFFAKEDRQTCSIEIHPKDLQKVVQAIRESFWDKLVEEIGFEPTVAYLEEVTIYW